LPQVKQAIWKANNTEILYKMHLIKAIEYDDILKSQSGQTHTTTHTTTQYQFCNQRIQWSLRQPRTHCFASLVNCIEYYWVLYCIPTLYRCIAVFCVILSLIILWCEATFWTVMVNLPNLSPFSQLLSRQSTNFEAQLIILAPLIYMTFCSLHSLFKLRFFSSYRIKQYQQTDDHSLLFSASWCARLIPSLSFNYLLIVHRYNGTAFSHVMSSMDVMGEKNMEWFNFVMSLCILILCLMTLLNIDDRIAIFCGWSRFQFEDEFHDQLIVDGEQHLHRERQRMIMERTKQYATHPTFISKKKTSQPTNATEQHIEMSEMNFENESYHNTSLLTDIVSPSRHESKVNRLMSLYSSLTSPQWRSEDEEEEKGEEEEDYFSPYSPQHMEADQLVMKENDI
jgi:hypothetical protein